MYMVLYMWYETQGFVAYSRALGYPVRPWLFPLLPCDPGNFVPIFLAFVLLVSDAPFRNRQQQFVLLRVGKHGGSRRSCSIFSFSAYCLRFSCGCCPGFSCGPIWSGREIGGRSFKQPLAPVRMGTTRM